MLLNKDPGRPFQTPAELLKALPTITGAIDESRTITYQNAALTWFGDPDPRIGTAWEKGERLAKLIAHRRTLLILDGLEPLQNPPGPQVYIPRIQQGNVSFAAHVLGAAGALLSVLVHFFDGRWDSPVKMGLEGQSLTAEDQLFILTQAGLYLSSESFLMSGTQGLGAPEARICYERAESLCHSLNRPLLLYSALIGQWRPARQPLPRLNNDEKSVLLA